MMLLVASTGPPFDEGLDKVANDVEEDDVKAVVPDNWDARGPWLMPFGYGFMELVLVGRFGAVYMRDSPGP